MVYGNRLIRLCCKMCQRDFKANPAKFLEKLDKAAMEAQRRTIPSRPASSAASSSVPWGSPSSLWSPAG